jgi:membrane protease YdiL (CAAX protease family)
LFAVALAEEVFHRGYLMSALEDLWPPRRSVLGAKVGLAAVVSSLLFAFGHLVGMAQAARLATFFPALVFAWLWRRSGSLWAPALFHTAANLFFDGPAAGKYIPDLGEGGRIHLPRGRDMRRSRKQPERVWPGAGHHRRSRP